MGQYTHNRRTRHSLRRAVDLIVADLADGICSLARAGARLDAMGCPFGVACRVCWPYRGATRP